MDVVSQRKNGRGDPKGLLRLFCCLCRELFLPLTLPGIARLIAQEPLTSQPPGVGYAQPAPGEYHPWKKTIADENGST